MTDDLYIAWIQTAFGREVVQITSAPQWAVALPYLENWKRPFWTVDIHDPTPRATAWNGQLFAHVRDLHPMNAATRELLRLRESRPPSPSVSPVWP